MTTGAEAGDDKQLALIRLVLYSS